MLSSNPNPEKPNGDKTDAANWQRTHTKISKTKTLRRYLKEWKKQIWKGERFPHPSILFSFDTLQQYPFTLILILKHLLNHFFC